MVQRQSLFISRLRRGELCKFSHGGMGKPDSTVWFLAAASWLAVISCSRYGRVDLYVVWYMEFAQKKKACRHCAARKTCAQSTTKNPSATPMQQQPDWPLKHAVIPSSGTAMGLERKRRATITTSAKSGAHKIVVQDQQAGDRASCIDRCGCTVGGGRITRPTDCRGEKQRFPRRGQLD